MSHFYKEGEELYHLGRKCKIVEHEGVDCIGMPEYRVNYLDSMGGEGYARETSLHKREEDLGAWGIYTTEYTKEAFQCECGQSNDVGVIHSSWCKLYSKSGNGVKHGI